MYLSPLTLAKDIDLGLSELLCFCFCFFACLFVFVSVWVFLIGKKWIYLERDTLHSVGPLQRWKVKVLITQLCLTLCYPMDCSLTGSSVHGIFQTSILEWVAIPFSRGTFWPRDQPQVPCIAGRFFTIWAKVRVAQKMTWLVFMDWVIS